MKLILSIFLTICLFASVFGDGCIMDGTSLEVGESYTPPGTCARFKCHANGDVTGLACPVMFAGPECDYIPEDTSKSYPDCCASFVCP
ncbi:U-scoloptoxin(16)-Cw1a-like [Episyrphus balteatus]|uniref:U-scoloptoxin(16)-Cw1a-like n=1 Tax=Episyrphus balteatus TaxID=286459 RepID=UPI002486BE04|nr:U-scoloptoxin(16)-Cw1a-like [Episyrphus balteatus]